MTIKGYGSAATLNGDVAERFAYAIKMVDCVFKNTLHWKKYKCRLSLDLNGCVGFRMCKLS